MSQINTDDTTATTPILEMNEVSFQRGGETSIHMNRFSDQISSGELVKVTLHRRHDPRSLASLMIGLHFPKTGTIRFDGQEWRGVDYTRHFKMRSRIGRVFAGPAWIQSLTVRDNIRLSMAHQRISTDRIKSNVDHWIERLSGSRISSIRHAMRKRPSFVEPSVLQVCQFIRAMSVRPRLLILERPLNHLVDEVQSHFIAAVDDLRLRGIAVIWFAGGNSDREVPFRDPVRQWTLVGDSLTGGPGAAS